MEENRLSKNILYYRKKKGLSQEKIAEYLNLSRQSVTKWENNISKPSSEHLIKLAELFEVSVETLLGYDEIKEEGKSKASNDSISLIFTGISISCLILYSFLSLILKQFHIGTLICIFIICVPIQMFLPYYFSYAIKNNTYDGIAGFDSHIQYNLHEVSKLCMNLKFHVEIVSTVYVFFFCVLNLLNMNLKYCNEILMIFYLLNFVGGIGVFNYRAIDKIYVNEEDAKRAHKGLWVTGLYFLCIFIAMIIVGGLFEIKGIENNTLSAIKMSGILLFGIFSLTISFVYENKRIKKAMLNHRFGVIGFLIYLFTIGLMFLI